MPDELFALTRGDLTRVGAAGTLLKMAEGRVCPSGTVGRAFSSREKGQTVVEYLLATLVLMALFVGLYGFLQGQVRRLFRQGAIVILRSYY